MTFANALTECWEAREATTSDALHLHLRQMRDELWHAWRAAANLFEPSQFSTVAAIYTDSAAAENAFNAGLKPACERLLQEVQHNLECLVMWQDDAHGVRTRPGWDEQYNEWAEVEWGLDGQHEPGMGRMER